MPNGTFTTDDFARLVDENEGLFTRKQAAEYAGVSIANVDYWIRRGLLPATKFGCEVRIEFDDLHKLCELRAKSPNGKLPRSAIKSTTKPAQNVIYLTDEQAVLVAQMLRGMSGATK